MSVRRIVSLLLFMVFAGVAASGVMIHLDGHNAGAAIAAQGRSHALQAGSFFLRRVHEVAGYVLIVLAIGHLAINSKLLLAHFGLRRKEGPGR